jgi:8-oxo-dGTP pyrophosphatase MutT (NUDIX family)
METPKQQMEKPKQIGALPVRRTSDGSPEIMLVTSRETRRWVIPKGWPWPDTADHLSAAGEAREEAGVVGEPSPQSIGSYVYGKRRSKGVVPVRVTVYLIDVTEELESWPEQHQRQRAWFSVADAAAAVEEPDLSALIQALAGGA